MLKKILPLAIALTMIVTLFGCGNKDKSEANKINSSEDKKIRVLVSFNPLMEFAKAVGKDKIEVETVIPEGTEPHDFEPKAKDLEGISNAQIFVYNGLGMENWVEKSLNSIKSDKIIVVDSSKGIDAIKNTEKEEIDEHGQFDPHIWLSLKNAEIQTKNIKDALVKVDSPNKDYYEKNYNEFIIQIEELYNDYNKKFASVTNKSFVTGHAAFAYFCRDFGLSQNSVEDVFAEGEPSAKNMKELVDYCIKNKINTIFVENMVSPKVSETLASEVGAKAQKIYTIESGEDNKNYIESMKANLEEVYNSLK